MANMKLIQAVTVGAGGAANIQFTNIPATYTDLVLKVSLRCASTEQWSRLEFNNTSYLTNWRMAYLQGNGAIAVAGSQADSYYSVMMSGSNETANTFGSADIYIANYASSNNKTISIDHVTENNATTAYQNLTSLLWSNSSAITSLMLRPSSGSNNYAQYSTAYLYGVTSVAVGAKATGGTVTKTATHWVHTFTSSGTFTPLQSLTADYLVVAGGGGGGAVYGAGGGAGGYLTSSGTQGGGGSAGSALSLTSGTNYTVTVGAGGAAGVQGTNNGSASNGSNSVFSTITSTGGGGGAGNGNASAQNAGGNGGSSGGGTYLNGAAGTRTESPVQGYNGGAGPGGFFGGGGGGGAGSAGVSGASPTDCAGGNGLANSITGSSVTKAGGGGAYNGAGGSGGGGAGSDGGNVGGSGNTNTGGGGGGAVINLAAGAGGSGIVIVRYAI